MEKAINILIVDDHKLFREGLKTLLKSLNFINEIYEASNGNEFLKIIKTTKPDIVFMDINMPEKDGIKATKEAIEIYPDLNIVALTMFGDEEYYRGMIEAGARGFLLKNSSIGEVEEAIKIILTGGNYFSQEILEKIIKGIIKPRKTEKTEDLTDREREVLYLICKGHSNKEIANILQISKRTVDKHRENLLLKTGCKNTAGLVMYAIKNDIIDL